MKNIGLDLSESINISVRLVAVFFILINFYKIDIKIIRTTCFCLGDSETHQLGEGWLGNDIFQFGSDSPIITPILNFSSARQRKNIKSPRFCLGGSKTYQEGGGQLGNDIF